MFEPVETKFQTVLSYKETQIKEDSISCKVNKKFV